MQVCNLDSARSKCAAQLGKFFPARLLRALSDPNRIAILTSLAGADEPQTVTEIASCCPTDLSVVSRHLATLRDAGVIEAQKQGRRVFYRVRFSELSAVLRQMADAIDACCPGGSTEVCCAKETNREESR